MFHLSSSKRFACGKMAIFDVGVRSCFPPLCSASPTFASLNFCKRKRARFGVLVRASCSASKPQKNTVYYTYFDTYRRSTILRWKLLNHRLCRLKSLLTMKGGLHQLKNLPFSREKYNSHIFEQFRRSSIQDLAGFSLLLFLLPIAPCTRAPQSLPAPARAFLLAPSLPIALRKNKKSLWRRLALEIVSLAAVLCLVTQRSSPRVFKFSLFNSIQLILFAPFNDFLQQYYSNSLGAGALNKPFWAYKESPWYINLLIDYSEFTWLCSISLCRYLFIKVLYKISNS